MRTFRLPLLLLTLPLLLPTSPAAPPALLLALPPRPQLAFTSRAGLTYDPCDQSSSCKPGRSCLSADFLFLCRTGESCICYPDGLLIECTGSSAKQCPAGEVCASRTGFPTPFCASAAAVAADASFTVVQGAFPPASASPGQPNPTSPPATNSPPLPPSPSKSPKPSSTPSPPQNLPSPNPPPPNPPSPNPASPSVQSSPAAPSKQPSTPPPPATQPAASQPPSPSNTPSTGTTATSPTPPAISPASQTPSAPQPTRTPLPAVGGGGLAGDPCSTAPELCRGYRKCLHPSTLTDCAGRQGCLCLGSRVCTCNRDCRDGEVCSGSASQSYCFSPTLIDSLPWATSIPCPASPMGLTGDLCRGDANCRTPRRCIAGGGDNCAVPEILCDATRLSCSITDQECYCFAMVSCNCTDDCSDTEACTMTPRGKMCVSRALLAQSPWLNETTCDDNPGGPVTNAPLPASPNADESPGASESPSASPSPSASAGSVPELITDSPTPSETTEASATGRRVCIDAELLRHLSGDELVFEQHAMAEVLCDKEGSCATAGHMVEFRQKAMMMRRYCEMVGCVRRVMKVNSPRRRRGLRVPSRTEGLEFTAFAAQWETRAEEVVLMAAVRLGM